MTAFVTEPEKLAMIFPVTEEAWNPLTPATQIKLVSETLTREGSRNPEVAELVPNTLEYDVRRPAELDGVRMPIEIQVGDRIIELPTDLVLVRATAMAFRA